MIYVEAFKMPRGLKWLLYYEFTFQYVMTYFLKSVIKLLLHLGKWLCGVWSWYC